MAEADKPVAGTSKARIAGAAEQAGSEPRAT